MRMLSASARPTASTARASAAPINLDTCHVYTFNIGKETFLSSMFVPSPDLLPVSLGGLDHAGPVALCDGLHLVRLGLGGELHRGRQLLLLAHDLLLLDLDLLPPLHHLDLDLLVTDLLLDLGRLQLVRQLRFGFL